MKPALHIVEPTLAGFTGHCHSLVRALAAAAAPDCEVTIWAGRGAVGAWDGAGALRPHFHRRWRRLQGFLLYRRLLHEPGRILVATAGSTDLALAAWAAGRGAVVPAKVHFFVHWLGRKAGKAGLLSSIARRQPNFEVLAPTATVAGFFTACGFRATQVPYPVDDDGDGPAPPSAPLAPFRHLLVAGGARLDKGFDHIVELVHEMKRCGLGLPVVVQASHSERDAPAPEIASAIERLRSAHYAGLSLLGGPLSPQAYRGLFDGAVVVQPYRAEDFRDRVSGVTLDALAAGCPVVVTAGTWMAAVAQRFDAGVATADLGAAGLLAAIESVVADHARYAVNARAAAVELNAVHSARRLIDAVLRPPPSSDAIRKTP